MNFISSYLPFKIRQENLSQVLDYFVEKLEFVWLFLNCESCSKASVQGLDVIALKTLTVAQE